MQNRVDIAKLLLRVTLGVLLLLHGLAKLQNGVGGIVGMVSSAGLPGIIGYGVIVGEVIAPLMILAGVYSRIGGWLAAVNMLFAIALVHSAEIFTLTQNGGWAIELQMFYLSSAVCVGLLGSGRLAVKPD
ncbi:MAG TPA: GntR family transcriptional regulator [Spongiibacteraceae bacterium]|nr:GntR family transcriptional regulator [Spongiibacteraceae bacterium]MBN51816.1 GntR family transcriptional regulator [Spongiibacteraceae bacterium]HCS27750.1 GntR family transcriptional regulator [Spongiibacteraceae bacterium]